MRLSPLSHLTSLTARGYALPIRGAQGWRTSVPDIVDAMDADNA